MKNKITLSRIVFVLVLTFVMFTAPLVVDVLLSIKFDYDLNKIDQMNITTGQYIYAYAKALLLESLIMVLLYAGWKKTSIAFTLTTGIVSLYFYNQFDFTEGIPKLSIEMIYAFIFPLVTAICSHIYIEQKQKEQDQQSNQFEDDHQTIEQQSNTINQQSKQLEEYSKEKDQQSNMIMKQSNTIEEYLNEIEKKSNMFEYEKEKYEYLESVIEEVRTCEDQQRTINKKQSKVIESQKDEIKKLRMIEVKYDEATKCPHCNERFNGGGLNRHVSRCAKNPKNMNVEQLEIR